jgi:hypothetical protein
MSDPLATYLHDHLAGSVHAIDLLESMRNQHAGEPLGHFAPGLLVEIEADRDVLRELAERLGVGSSGLKELAAWVGEKVSRIKLGSHDAGGFGTFEALELLELGIHGKRALWCALAVVAETDARLQSTDYACLAARAETQEASVEEQRLAVARTAFRAANWPIVLGDVISPTLVNSKGSRDFG